MADELKRGRNWWKIAFFVLLFMFELARELLVVSSGPQARPVSRARVFAMQGYVVAEGTWKRIDGGGKLVPGTVTIECREERGECVEANTAIHDNSVFSPDLSLFKARFTAEAVTYENDFPDCARYTVRIDLKLEKTFATRERKENPGNENCAKLEPRIEMQLADGYEYEDPTEGHFLPLFTVIKIVAAAF